MHPSGRLIPGNLNTEYAIIVLVALVAAREEIQAMAGAAFKAKVKCLIDRAEALLAALQAFTKGQDAPHHDPSSGAV